MTGPEAGDRSLRRGRRIQKPSDLNGSSLRSFGGPNRPEDRLHWFKPKLTLAM